MCGDCWNAAMGAPAAVVAARFAWVGYKDRIPFLGRAREVDTRGQTPSVHQQVADEPEADPTEELADAGASSP